MNILQNTDTMSCISDSIDLKWLAIFGPSLYVHYYSHCVIGMCQDLRINYVASFESTLFVFTICSLLAEWSLWPKSLKRPPNALLYTYMSLASLLLTNIAFRLVWLPFLDLQTMINKELSSWLATICMCLGFDKESQFFQLSEWLATPSGVPFGSQIWSILLFLWMLHATNKFGATWNYIERMYTPFVAAMSTEFNQKPRGRSRRGYRRRPNYSEYLDDDFQSPTIIDAAEEQSSSTVQTNPNIPWDEDTE